MPWFTPGRCHRCVASPVMYVALHIPCPLARIWIRKATDREFLRHLGLLGSLLITDEDRADFWAWVKTTPLLEAWLKSDDAFFAPEKWPERVAPLFKPYEITPRWVGSLDFPSTGREGNRYSWLTNHPVKVLQAYCRGWAVNDLFWALGLRCEGEVIDMLKKGAQMLLDEHRIKMLLSEVPVDMLPLGYRKDVGLFTRMKGREEFKRIKSLCRNYPAFNAASVASVNLAMKAGGRQPVIKGRMGSILSTKYRDTKDDDEDD